MRARRGRNGEHGSECTGCCSSYERGDGCGREKMIGGPRLPLSRRGRVKGGGSRLGFGWADPVERKRGRVGWARPKGKRGRGQAREPREKMG